MYNSGQTIVSYPTREWLNRSAMLKQSPVQMRLADKVFNTRGRSIKVGTSYGSVSQLQTLGSYIVILLNDKSLEES